MTSTATLEVHEIRPAGEDRIDHTPGGCTDLPALGIPDRTGLQQHLRLVTGGATPAFVLASLVQWLGFALGAIAGAELLRRGRVRRPLRWFGLLQLAAGILVVVRVPPEWQSSSNSAGRGLDGGFISADRRELRRGVVACVRSGTGGRFGSIARGACAILPEFGMRGALWISFALGIGICGSTLLRPEARRAHRPALVAQPGFSSRRRGDCWRRLLPRAPCCSCCKSCGCTWPR